jgi:NTE family protein
MGNPSFDSATERASAEQWVVDSPANGTGLSPRPCGDPLRAAEPAPSPSPLAVAISGGGFRATLAGAGVMQLLADSGSLGDLRYVSSVSGGSVTNGILAVAWPKIRAEGFTGAAVTRHLVEPVVQRICGASLKWALFRGIWRTVGDSTRTDLLARRFDEWWLGEEELERLDPHVRWIINAANLVTGVRFPFERDVVGDYTMGLTSTKATGLRVSTAVAASAAVPGAFAPLTLRGLKFPCGRWDPVLMDGGTYDNTGLQALTSERHREAFLVCLNAGGLLRPGPYGKVPVMRDLARANSLLYRQSTGLRTASMVDRFRLGAQIPLGQPLPVGARRGVLAALSTTMPDPAPIPLREWRTRFPERREHAGTDLSLVPTVFDKLDEGLCRALVYRGWWLAGAVLALYYPDRLGDFSDWSPPGG